MSWLLDWFWDFLYALGFFKKKATILLLGLDNAGKTTLLHKLKHNSIHLFHPTERAQLEEVTVGNVVFRAWDLGGHQAVRHWWKDHFTQADAIIFVVDSADQERFEEAHQELKALLKESDLMECKAFLILGNKLDVEGASSKEQLISAFKLSPFLDRKKANNKKITRKIIIIIIKKNVLKKMMMMTMTKMLMMKTKKKKKKQEL